MERKHQVFVSSTYRDLVEERKEVIHALLELDCIPAGMELFPATNEDAWSLIKEVIDGSDYYLLILAGKYGSTNPDGIGFTEMEYDYVVEKGKPIISFVIESTEDLPSSKVEGTDKGKERLNKFRDKVKQKHCKFWTNAPDLGGKVSRSLIQLKKKHPSDGWVPGRFAVDQKMLAQMEKMRTRIAELEYQAISSTSSPPSNIDELAHGKDEYGTSQTLVQKDGETKESMYSATWDTIFSYCGLALTGECSDSELLEKITLIYWHAVPLEIRKKNNYSDIVIPYVCEDQIKIQLQAIGLMEHGAKKRAVSDTNTYWKLTPYGEKYLISIKAKRR